MKEQIECACGCGQKMDKTDKWGRKRKFISGHNRRKYPHDDKYAYKKEWRKKNLEWRRNYRRNTNRQRKMYLMALAGNKCCSCGLEACEKNKAAFDFHHRDPNTKDFDVCQKIEYAWVKLVEEIKKCDLICANCHRILHDE